MHSRLQSQKLSIPKLTAEDLTAKGFLCGFEFETVIALPGATREALADAFANEFNATIGTVSNTYAGHKRQGEADYTKWHFTRDGSIQTNQRNYDELPEERRFLPIEVISPIIKTSDALDLMTRSYLLLSYVGGTTNESCGLHFTFSSPHVTRETFNPLVFLLLTSSLDQRDLRKTERLGNRYCYPTLTLFSKAWRRLRAFCGAASLSADHLTDPELGRGVVRLAGLSRHRHVSVNLVKFQTDGVIEYRGFGGDYLNKTTPEQVTKAMCEYMTCALLASDPVWIKSNLTHLLRSLTLIDNALSYHTRMTYTNRVSDVPGDMDIMYIGSQRDIPGDEDDASVNEVSFVDGNLRLELSANLGSSRRATLFLRVVDLHTNTQVATLIINSHEPMYIDVHRNRFIRGAVYGRLITLAKQISEISDLDKARRELLRFFTSRTYRHNRGRYVEAMSRIMQHRKAMLAENRPRRAGWLSIAHHLRDIRRNNESRRPDASAESSTQQNVTYEWLSAVYRSYNKVAGGSIFSNLLDRDMSYSSVDDFLSNYKGSITHSLTAALTVGNIAGKSVEDLELLTARHNRSELHSAVSLLREHNAQTVSQHLSEKVHSDITKYLDVGNRCFFEPSLDVACAFIKDWHSLVGLDAPRIVPSADDLLCQARRLLRSRLHHHLSFLQSAPVSDSRVTASIWADFLDQFKADLFRKFMHSLQSYESSWSHSSRHDLAVFVLGELGVYTAKTDTLKERLNSRDLRKYEQMRDKYATMQDCPLIP